MRPVCGPPVRSEQITTLKYNPSSLPLTTSILKESCVGKINSRRNSPQGERCSFFAVFLHQEENKLSDWSFSALKCTTMSATAAETERSLLQMWHHVRSSLITQCLCYISLFVWVISHLIISEVCTFISEISGKHKVGFAVHQNYCSCEDKAQLKNNIPNSDP